MLRREAAAQIVEAGRRMYQQRLVVASQGNLSARLEASTVLTTPAGVCKGKLQASDLLETDLQGNCRRGTPSSELRMHLAIYRSRGDVAAVIHGHPTWATALATAGRALDTCLLPEVIVGLGSVPLSRYAAPGTEEVAEAVCEQMLRHDAVLMPNHGVVACGKDVLSALYKLETVEHLARITLISEIAGGGRVLTREEVETLWRQEGYGSPRMEGPGCRPAEAASRSGELPGGGLRPALHPPAAAPSSDTVPPGTDPRRVARIVAEEVARALREENGVTGQR